MATYGDLRRLKVPEKVCVLENLLASQNQWFILQIVSYKSKEIMRYIYMSVSSCSSLEKLGRAITLTELQTLIVEIKETLHERPITYILSNISDEGPLIPSYLYTYRLITPSQVKT